MNTFKNEKDVTKVKFQQIKVLKYQKISYHLTFEKRSGISSASSFEEKSKVTVPVDIIERVLKRCSGMEKWPPTWDNLFNGERPVSIVFWFWVACL